MPSTIVTAWIDGAARGNPGPAGVGVVLADATGKPVRELSVPLGATTNNVAEYAALLVALAEAARVGAKTVTVRTDSELLARQVNGEYRVKDATLRIFHALAQQFLAVFPRQTVVHIPREQNRAADRLANRAAAISARAKAKPQAKRPAADSTTQQTFRFESL